MYLTIVQELRNNGDRHAANAQKYIDQGKTEYAKGSMLKAERNWKHANEIEGMMKIDPIFDPLINKFAQKIANTILNGE